MVLTRLWISRVLVLYSDIRRVEELDFSPLCHKFAYKPQMVIEVQGCFTCSGNSTANLGKYEMSLEAVQQLSKTSNCGMFACCVNPPRHKGPWWHSGNTLTSHL